MSENQLISSHLFAEYLKQCCILNSERLLWTPADEKDGSREIANSRDGAVSMDRSAEDSMVAPLHGATESGGVRRKGPDNEAWI